MKNLIIVRAGDTSLHSDWKNKNAGNFDIFVCYYGTEIGKYKSYADLYATVPGLKYPVIAQHLKDNGDLLKNYDAFWFPDDDLRTSPDISS